MGSLATTLAVAFSICLLASLPCLLAQNAKPSEYSVKAVYLFNFGRFVEWPAKLPEAEGNSFDICVLGQDPFGAALKATVSRETIAGKSVIAKEIAVPKDAANCRVLFISSSEDGRLKQILDSLGTASILTVSDLPRFIDRGGMVQFVLEGDRVRFEVNSAITERAGLTLSSELLKVAVEVKTSAPLGD